MLINPCIICLFMKHFELKPMVLKWAHMGVVVRCPHTFEHIVNILCICCVQYSTIKKKKIIHSPHSSGSVFMGKCVLPSEPWRIAFWFVLVFIVFVIVIMHAQTHWQSDPRCSPRCWSTCITGILSFFSPSVIINEVIT